MTRGSTSGIRTAQVTKLLANDKAQFVSFESRNRIWNNELTRFWPVERDDLVDIAYQYLLTIDSVANPQVGPHETFTGTWRVVDVRKMTFDNEAQHQGVSGVVQVLRYGYAQTTAAASIDWTEARIINYRGSEGNGTSVTGVNDTASDNPDKFMLIEFVNLDPSTAPSLVASFADPAYALPSPNVTIRGRTFTSADYHVIAATLLESEFPGDGSARIQLLIAQPQYTLDAYREYIALWNGMQARGSVYYLWGVPKNLAQEIIDNFEGAGRSVTADYNRDASLVNLTLTDKLWHTLYGIYTGDLGAGGACSYTDTIQFVWGLYDPTNTDYDPSNFDDYGTAGITYDRQITFDRETGTFNIMITRRQAITRRYSPYTSRYNAVAQESTYKELSVTDGVYFDFDNSEPPQGLMYDQNINPNPDCSLDVTSQWTQSIERAWADSIKSQGVTHNFYWFLNQRSFPAVIDNVDETYNNTLSISMNPDKTYDVTVTSAPDATTITGYTNFYYTEANIQSENVVSKSPSVSTDKTTTRKNRAVYTVHRVTYHASENNAYQNSIGGQGVSRHGPVWRCDRIVRVFESDLADNTSHFYLTGFNTAGDTSFVNAS